MQGFSISSKLYAPFSPEVSAAIYEAESLIFDITSNYMQNKMLQTIRVPLLAIEAAYVVRCENEQESSVDILELIHRFNKEKSINGDDFFMMSETDGIGPLKNSPTSIDRAFNLMCALSWVSNNITPKYVIDTETIRMIHDLCLRGYIVDGRTSGFRKKEIIGTMREYCAVPHNIPYLVEELNTFSNAEMFSPLGQASKVHYCFELIYPFDKFVDITGLLLAYSIMFKRGLIKGNLILPYSWGGSISHQYRQSVLHPYLSNIRNPQRDLNQWALFNAHNTVAGAKVAKIFFESMVGLHRKWCKQVNHVSPDSILSKLLILLLGVPKTTVRDASFLLGRSFSAVNDAFARLERAGIVKSKHLNSRDRIFIATESLKLISRLTDELSNRRSEENNNAVGF